MAAKCDSCHQIISYASTGTCPHCGGILRPVEGADGSNEMVNALAKNPAFVRVFVLAVLFIAWSWLVSKYMPQGTPSWVVSFIANVVPVLIFALLYRISEKFWFFKYFTYVLLIAGVVMILVTILNFSWRFLWNTVLLFIISGICFWWKGVCDAARQGEGIPSDQGNETESE